VLVDSRDNFLCDKLLIPCLSIYALGTWDPKSLSWLKNHSINHTGPYADIDNLNNICKLTLQRLHLGSVLEGYSLISIEQGLPNYYHTCARIVPDIICAANHFAIDNIVIADDTRFLREYLDLLHINSNIHPVRNKGIACELAIIPKINSGINNNDQLSLTILKNKIVGANNFFDNDMPKKVFIERRSSNNSSQYRRVYPVEALHEDLKNNKWQIIYMEDLSVYQQIKLFYNASKIMAVHGAALTNIIYCNESAHIYEIVHAKGSPDCFIRLSTHLSLNRYKQVSCNGFLSDLEEERLKLILGNMSNNSLPLSYNEQIRQIVFS
jgi:capsular polysaccharide biosynthesis protein